MLQILVGCYGMLQVVLRIFSVTDSIKKSTLRCLRLSRKLFAKAHQAKASNDDDQKIYSRK